jgi:transcriptional regulator with XRE-family HTH domain
MALGKRIKTFRESKGLSQEALAELTNGAVSQGAISALEKRDSQSSRFALELAKALGVSVNDLHDSNNYEINPKIAHLLKLAQELPDYAIDEVIRDAIKTAELITRAKADKNGTNNK